MPGGVWVLGFVSLLMDASSELVHSVLPIFMASGLGASMATIGMVEGVAEATASVTKVFSGIWSDRLAARKRLVVLGYGLSALTKPLFPLATSVVWVFGGRFVDRVGKGIRGAPRDALIADLTPVAGRGAAYGLRQALDSAGAVIGPVLAVVFMAAMANDLTQVMWVAVVPAVAAVTLLTLAVREPRRTSAIITGERPRLSTAIVRQLPRRYWNVVGWGAVFTLARFSEAFLVLRAQDVGLAIGYVPAVLIAMNLIYAGTAFPAGLAADRLDSRRLLAAGVGVLTVAHVILAVAATPMSVLVGSACWGVHMGLTQGVLSKLVADAAPESLRGTAFGVFNLVSGGALLLASLIAGTLWSSIGPSATFGAGGFFAAVALVSLLAYRPRE